MTTRNMRRGLELAAAMCKAQYAGAAPSAEDIARLFCALQLGAQGFPPELAWTWAAEEVLGRIETSIELRPPTRAIEGKGAA